MPIFQNQAPQMFKPGTPGIVSGAGVGTITNMPLPPTAINPALAPFLKDNQLDLVSAVKAGVTDLSQYQGWDITQADINNAVAIASLAKYSTDNKTYDLAKAVRDGVSTDTLKAAGFTPEQIKKATEPVPTPAKTSSATEIAAWNKYQEAKQQALIRFGQQFADKLKSQEASIKVGV